ncbi:hypothetical protein EGH24_04310 [Halonotius terrestris]|uniref:Uncharacterized protein n=1 Tax=Halonotius terrestris TaxID=2487750 RepID=A0A8J8PCF2_9EURY|nr:hypothetical protein EGH24_04310 [Halonotius terrestris]
MRLLASRSCSNQPRRLETSRKPHPIAAAWLANAEGLKGAGGSANPDDASTAGVSSANDEERSESREPSRRGLSRCSQSNRTTLHGIRDRTPERFYSARRTGLYG